MRVITGARAASILYDLLRAHPMEGAFLLPANICPVVALTFRQAQRPFELIDLDPASLGMDMAAVQRRVRKGGVGGVLYAHTYGTPFTPEEEFAEIKARDERLLLIDDRCLCVPALEAPAKSSADVALYSTGYAKIVDLGRGGYAFVAEQVPTRHEPLHFDAAALQTAEAAWKKAIEERTPYREAASGWLESDPRPDWEALRTEIARALPGTLAVRGDLNAIYRARLPEAICLAEEFQLWRFSLRVKDKAALLQALRAAGLFASSHYASLGGIFSDDACPVAEGLHAEVVNLFNDQHYTAAMAEATCVIIRSVL